MQIGSYKNSRSMIVSITENQKHFLYKTFPYTILQLAYLYILLLISQFVTNQICSHVTDLLSFVSLAFLCNPADFLPDYLFHLQCYI